jgi:outer membrane protein OmpA-like peptidoglycan-associated protein
MRELVELGDQLVIVSQLVEGVSVADRLMVGPFDPLQVGVLIGELLSALACAHHAGLAHGRVSPSTVVIDDTGKLRLMDLGVQYRGASIRGDLSAAGTLASTMLSGSGASVPPQLASWIERSASFTDADTSLAALLGQTAVKRIVIPAKGSASPKPAPTKTLLGVPSLERPAATSETKPVDDSTTAAGKPAPAGGAKTVSTATVKTLIDGSTAAETATGKSASADDAIASTATKPAVAGDASAAAAKTLIDGASAAKPTAAAKTAEASSTAAAAKTLIDDASAAKPTAAAKTAEASSTAAAAKTLIDAAAKTAEASSSASTDAKSAFVAAASTSTTGEVATLDEIAAIPPAHGTDDERADETPPAPVRRSRFVIAGGVAAAAIVALALWLPASPGRTSDRVTPPVIASAPTARPAPGDRPPLPTGALLQPVSPDPAGALTEPSQTATSAQPSSTTAAVPTTQSPPIQGASAAPTTPAPTSALAVQAPTTPAPPTPAPTTQAAATPATRAPTTTQAPPTQAPSTERAPTRTTTQPPDSTRASPRTASRAAGETIAQIPFSPESAWIEKPAVYVLEDVYRQLLRDPLARIEISGHTSSDGDGKRNYQLAMGRAYSARNYLVQRGIDEARIEVVLRPDQAPIASNDTVEGRAANRRADVRLIPSAPR